MASMRDIKRRRNSVQSTRQITKAMKLVATVKLQRARNAAEDFRTYFESMHKTVQHILSRTGQVEHKYLKSGESTKKAVVVVTSNRGLAGGYHTNVTKLITGQKSVRKEDVAVYAIGSKGGEILERSGYQIKEDLSHMAEEPCLEDAKELTDRLLQSFEKGEIGEIYLAYTVFKNTVSQIPTLLKLLPVDRAKPTETDTGEENILMNYEPDEETVLGQLIPQYITCLIYGGMVEGSASENAARMQAMDNATGNAEEMLEDLTLMYNRARQSSITQELTEIIAGAEALV